MIKQATANRRGLPEPLIKIQELHEPWMDFFITAATELGTTRSIGMGLGQIPWDRMRDYARDYGFEGEDFELFRTVIRKMDEVVLKRSNKGSE